MNSLCSFLAAMANSEKERNMQNVGDSTLEGLDGVSVARHLIGLRNLPRNVK